MRVENQSGDVVGFMGNHRLVEEALNRRIRQLYLRRYPFFGGMGGHARQFIAGAWRTCFAEQRFQGHPPIISIEVEVECAAS